MRWRSCAAACRPISYPSPIPFSYTLLHPLPRIPRGPSAKLAPRRPFSYTLSTLPRAHPARAQSAGSRRHAQELLELHAAGRHTDVAKSADASIDSLALPGGSVGGRAHRTLVDALDDAASEGSLASSFTSPATSRSGSPPGSPRSPEGGAPSRRALTHASPAWRVNGRCDRPLHRRVDSERRQARQHGRARQRHRVASQNAPAAGATDSPLLEHRARRASLRLKN